MLRSNCRRLGALLLVVANVAQARAAVRPFYFNLLGSLYANGESHVYDINDDGTIVGYSDNSLLLGSPSKKHATAWSARGATMTDVGTLIPGNFGMSAAVSINNHGDITGYSAATTAYYYHAFLKPAGGTIADLGTIDGPTGELSEPWQIDDRKTVVGRSYKDGASGIGTFLYTPATGMREVPLMQSQGLGRMNNSSQIVGTTVVNYLQANSYVTSFIQQPDGTRSDLPSYVGEDSTSPLPTSTMAGVINDNGVVAGSVRENTYDLNHAAVLMNGVWTKLPSLPTHDASDAVDLNNAGQVIGTSWDSSQPRNFSDRPVLWDHGNTIDLRTYFPSSQTVLQNYAPWVVAINNKGEIVGNLATQVYAGLTTYNVMRGFLLEPATSGDANLDQRVDFSDLLTLAKHYGMTSGRSWADGDFDLNGSVDFGDLLELARHYGDTQTSATANASSAFAADWLLAQALAPEPAALCLLAAGAALLQRRRN